MKKEQEVERIESLRRVIKSKKDNLGLNGDILYLKTLKKFSDLSDFKYPKSVSVYKLYVTNDIQKRFNDVSYTSIYKTNKVTHIFNKLVETISKKVISDFKDLCTEKTLDEAISNINQYIKEKTLYFDYSISKPSDTDSYEFAKSIIYKNSKEKSNCIVVINGRHKFSTDLYTTIDTEVPKKATGSWKGRGINEGKKTNITNFSNIIAEGILAKEVSQYLSNEDNFEKIKEKFSKIIVFNNEPHLFKTMCSDTTMRELLEDNIGHAITPLQVLIALSMEDMLKKSFEIVQYEDRLKSLSGDYAKTYMTKKNIPKKIQNFMDDNLFLNMFGFVEADEECELEKLNKLSEEFKILSNDIFLPKVKNHSLRFRKLGKLRALGVYYPGFDTLAIDLDGISSFIHEMFHMIDFENDILSLNNDFEPLLIKYKELVDEKINYYGEDSEVYSFWYKGKSKYSRAYYLSNEEAFARMGELYVTNILKLNSSFSKIDYSSPLQQAVYPKDKELLGLIESYYSKLFSLLEDKFERVVFA